MRVSLKGGSSPGIETVEVRFICCEGDQGRKGALLGKTKVTGIRREKRGNYCNNCTKFTKEGWNYRRRHIPELKRLASVDEKPSNPLPIPGAVSTGRGVGKGRGKWESTIGSEGI